jgi:hypothetical protein
MNPHDRSRADEQEIHMTVSTGTAASSVIVLLVLALGAISSERAFAQPSPQGVRTLGFVH